MTAAGSPGVRRSRPNTTSATTAMTGMVAASRRMRRGSSYLPLDRDVPVETGREGQHTLHVLPVRGGLRVLAPGDVRYFVIGERLHLVRDLPAFCGLGGADPLATQRFHLLAAVPAEPRLVAPARQPRVHRGRHHVGRDPGRHHEVPAAGLRWILLAEAGDDALPVLRL